MERTDEMKTKKSIGKFRPVFCLMVFSLCFIVISGFVKINAASYAKTIELKLKDGQDATSEIQKALDDAAKSGTSKKQALVVVPKGTYLISDTLIIGSNTCLKLDKKTFIKKNPKSRYGVLYMVSVKKGSKGKYLDNSNITIQGGVWDAGFIKFTDTSGGSVFMFAHTNKLKILDATICNNFGTHLIELGGVKNCTIKGCELYGFKTTEDGTDKEAIQLDICHSDSILHGGEPFDDTPCEKITVSNCKIHDYPRGIGSHIMVEGIYHKTIKITNNNFYDLNQAAVYGYNYVNLTVKGNTMKNVWCGVQLKSDSTAKKTKMERNSGVKAMTLSNGRFNLNVTDNTITLSKNVSADEQDSGSSIGVFIYGSETAPIKNATIKGNTINCFSAGVYIRYVESCEISENYIDRYSEAKAADKTKFVEDAIKLLESANAKIDGNHISENSTNPFENGIALRDNCKNTVVNNNTVKMAAKAGIGLYSTCSITEGTGNTILNSGGNGITVMDAVINLDNCTVNNSKGRGISVQGDSKLTLTNSTFKNNDMNAVQVIKGDVTISGNTFKDNCLSSDSDKAVAIFGGVKGKINGNNFDDPKTNYELWIASGASLSPQVSSVKTSVYDGYKDIAGNEF